MGSEIVNNFFNGSQWLQNQVGTIAGKIASEPLTSENYELLQSELDRSFEALQALKQKAESVFVRAHTETLEKDIIGLYQELNDRFVEREISLIQTEAAAIERSMEEGHTQASAVDQLRKHILSFESAHRPLAPQLKVIADAKRTIAQAKNEPIPHHFDWLSKQHPQVQFVENGELLPGDIEELFEIAYLLYKGDIKRAKRQYFLLPQAHKQLVEKHMAMLAAQLFEHRNETMQSLIASVNELVGNGQSFPTPEEMEELLLGVAQCIEEDQGKLFSLTN
jgi:hypothetical protein